MIVSGFNSNQLEVVVSDVSPDLTISGFVFSSFGDLDHFIEAFVIPFGTVK